MSIEETKQQSLVVETGRPADDLEVKLGLERGVMEYGCKFLKISEEDWVKYFGTIFAELYNDPDMKIRDRFLSKEVYDKNPEEFYKEIQEILFVKAKEKERKDRDLVNYL
ncbi:MAG: hypothetical protein V4469_04180 [Patescibacteria group bacterium]